MISRLEQAGQTAGGRGVIAQKHVVAWLDEPLKFGQRVQAEARRGGLAEARESVYGGRFGGVRSRARKRSRISARFALNVASGAHSYSRRIWASYSPNRPSAWPRMLKSTAISSGASG